MTASQLLSELRQCGCEPGVDGFDLVFDSEPPAHLAPFLAVLHTGVRAILTGRRWFGIDPTTGRSCGPQRACGSGPLAFGALDPTKLLPRRCGLLCVEKDPCLDRIHYAAFLDSPAVFEPEEPAQIRRIRHAVEGGEVTK
jgi:hypothetical protein